MTENSLPLTPPPKQGRNPVVTVILPIYNAERFLRETVLSIRAQTFQNFEVIAILDGCTDRSEEILNELKDERLVVVKKENNQGIVASLNLGVERASAPYLARMDHDDVMHPDRLKKQVEFLDSHPEIVLAGTRFDYIDERGRFVKEAMTFPTGHEEIKQQLRRFNCIGGPTTMCRTAQIREIGGYLPDYPLCEDLSLYFRLLVHGWRLANLPDVLLHYRIHAGQTSRKRLAQINSLALRAYREFGPLIWGDVPNVEFGAPLQRRIVRRVRRLFTKTK